MKTAENKSGSLSLCLEKRGGGRNMEMKEIRREERSEGYHETEEKRSIWGGGGVKEEDDGCSFIGDKNVSKENDS